jgi:nucleotide-binding universal stress UspA family protein
MYRTILVPLDGSPFGEQALPLALGIARRAGAALELIHVFVTPAAVETELRLPVENTFDAKARAEARAYLDGMVQRPAASGVPVRGTYTEAYGSIPEAIGQQAADRNVDLVVLTTHGRGPLSRFWLGSVADELVRQLTVPLLLVRPREGKPDLAGEPVLRHLLVPLDGSPLAEQVLEPAIELGRLMSADYTLLRVVRPVYYLSPELGGFGGVGPDPQLLKDLQTQAESYLAGVAERLRARSLRVQTQVCVEGHVPGTILQEAEKRGSDLVALATHGQGGLGRLLRGSVADKVIRGGMLPVFVYRPGDKK